MPFVYDDEQTSTASGFVFDDEQADPAPAKQDRSWLDSVSEFGLDLGKRAAGAVVGGVAAMPLGVEKSIKAGVRGSVTGGSETVMPGSVFMPGIDTDEAVFGPESERDKNVRALAGERAASAVPSIPFSQTISDLGTKAREKIHGTASPETQEAVANSQISGNLFKGEIDFGKDPSVRGFVMQASDVFGSMLPVVATALITKNPNAGAAVGGSMAAGEGANSAQEFIGKKTDAELQAQSPFFAKMLEAGASPAEARQLTLDKASESAAALQGLVASFGDKFTGKLVTGQLDGLIAKAAGKSAAGKIVTGGVLSGGEEGFQEVTEGVASDVGIASTVPSKEIGEDSAANLVLGALGGGPAGSARGAYSAWRESAPKPEITSPENTPNPPQSLTQQGKTATNTVAPAAAPTAAEQALATPVQLTSLDRVNEIDKNDTDLSARLAELNAPDGGYGPMFDQERQDLAAQRTQLGAEKQALTQNWPKSVDGLASSFTTEAGARVEAKYALIESSDLVTSHDEALRQNPAYPQELQPRQRDRAASEIQVAGIVQKLDPARLGLSADAANGAPIIGADGLVESGNARTIALKRIYQANGQKAEDYKQFLRDNAGQFGVTPDAVNAMTKPVLVRVRTTPVNRAEFARQANASTVAMMSPSEQAKSDSSRIDSMEDLTPDDNGDFSNAASRPFVQRFMARLPTTEQVGMVDATGNLSTAGYARVRNAVLAKAYGDSPVLARMTESMDDNLRNVSRAFLLAAPKVASMRAAVKDGTRFDADITPDLMAAAEELSKIKSEGGSVQDALAQIDMMGEQRTPEARQLLEFMDANMRRPRRMAEFISAYMDALDAAGDPNQGSLLGDVQAPAKQDLLKAAERTTQDAAQNTQRGNPGKDSSAGEKTGIQSQNAPGAESGAQGDGAAGRDTRLSRQQDSAPVGEPSEWVNFPKDSGTIGIPRADMPQIKGDHRGALIQFLAARGIAHKTKDVAASDLKPTQAEFSTKKAAKWSEVRDGVDRSVLVSRDGHILDGHHQWIAALAANEPIKAIVLDANIRELMTNVFQFPSVKQSDDSARAAANGGSPKPREDFKAAMGELADLIADRLGLRVAMMPSGDAKLHQILVKLFDSAIQVVGTDLKAATKWVKAQLKGNPATKIYWNKVTDKDYQEAALVALEQQAKVHVDDLFNAAEKSQADLFSSAPEAPKVAMIDGQAYNYAPKGGDNFETPATSTFVPAAVLAKAKDQIDRLHKAAAPVQISQEDRSRAEKLLTPLIESTNAAKVGYDQKIIDIAKRTGALGQMLATVKSMDSAARKLATENWFDVSKMRDMLRSTIVVSQYADAQAVLDAIRTEFEVIPGRIKNMTDAKIDGKTGEFDGSGYGHVLINVKLPSGVIAEIQINVPEMLAVKLAEGHALYEIERAEKEGSQARADAVALQNEIYPLAAAAAVARKDFSLDRLEPGESGKSLNGVKRNNPVSSSSPNTLPSGNLTNSVASPLVENTQPGGKTSGTFIESPLTSSLTEKPNNGYTENQDGQGVVERTPVQIAMNIARESPDGDVMELREKARKAIVDELGQKALEQLQPGSFMRTDDLTQAIHDGQYAALREFAAAMPVPVHEADIPRDIATHAHSGTSYSPEKRGDSTRRGYVRAMVAAWKQAELATRGDADSLARVTAVMADLVGGYRDRMIAALEASSRVMSSMIAGPANFPVASNRKKSDTADKRANEADDYLKKGIAKMHKAARAPIDNSPDSELARVQANLAGREAQQARMKAVNATHAKFQRDPATLAKSGLSDQDQQLVRDHKPRYSWEPHPFAPYELTNNNAEIRRLKDKLTEASTRVSQAADGPVASERSGVRVEENAQDDRIRLFFDEKPGEEIRADLKGHGFRWSPTAGAWQRQLTDNARGVVQRLLDKHFPVTTLSRGAGGGMDLKTLKALAYRIRSNMPNMPDVHVYASPADLPERAQGLRDYIIEQGAQNDVEGAMHKGELYLFASGLSDALRAEHVLAEHEAGHFGLRAILGDSLGTTMLMIYNNNTYVRQVATELQKRGKLSNAQAAEEAIVDIPSARLVKLQGWRKLVVNVRNWLETHGYEAMAAKIGNWLDGSLSDQQRADLFVADLVRNAREYVAGKRDGKPGAVQGTMLASTLAEDIAKQEKWLRTEARARGYQDIDDLVDRNYPLFEKLALLWRKKNPAENGVLLSRSAEDAYAKAARLWQSSLSGKLNEDMSVTMPMPTVYRRMNMKESGLSLPVRYLQKIADDHKDVPREVFQNMPRLLSDPVVVYPWAKGYRVIVDAQTAKGEPIAIGLSIEGRIQTITPIHNTAAELGADVVSGQLNNALATSGIKVYARNKEALVKTRAPRGVAIGTRSPNRASSTGESPAIFALPLVPRDKSIVIYRGLVVKELGAFGPGIRLSRATPQGTPAERADKLIQTNAATAQPLDAIARTLTRVTGVERLTGAIYNRAAYLLDRLTPETVKAGMVSDYGVPEAVIDQRAMMQGRQRVQLRQAGNLIDKLSTLTRAESRIAYAWMNEQDPHTIYTMMQNLPEESVKVLQEVQTMIDRLSKDAVRMGQLSPEAYEANKFAYLRRSYVKYTLDLTPGEQAGRARAISVLGDQYKGRGLTEAATMAQIQNAAPEWWQRKMVKGKADTSLKGEKLIRLERRAPSGQKTGVLPGVTGNKAPGKILEVHFFPAGERLPAKYADWTQADTFEVRDVKGDKVVLWRDFTKDEREKMGEIDEARFAIAKTLQGMVHDVEVGRYLEWLAHNYAKKEGETIPGVVVDASEKYRDTFKPGEWVRVPDSKLPGTNVLKYGKLAGRYLEGPVWNDLRQSVNGQFRPFGDTYGVILSAWKTAKTALSPAVHTNNIMSNFVMADWHDVTAGHTAKALRILLGAHTQDGKGLLGGAGNKAASVIGMADRAAAREVLNRYQDSGGDIGSWATNEISTKQIEPLLEALEKELAATGGQSAQAQVGVFHALQNAMQMKFPTAWESLKGSMPGKVVGTEAQSLIDLYQSEDDVFRLAAWLKAKEDGRTDMEAGKIARRSFMDYSINAPWVQALRNSALPFISYTYRAVPMMLETAAKKPHKLLKLMAFAGALNAFGLMLSGGAGDDDDRKLLPEEKAGRIWGMVPKLIRMPWNDTNGSPVYLDIRRFIPVGDVFDIGAGHSAIPMLPALTPGGPLAIMAELVLNKTQFTGKPITLDTDTGAQQAAKVLDYLYKAFMPNVIGLPGTYATTGVVNAASGKTDAFGREQSVAQAMASSFGVKLGSYPADVLRKNLQGRAAGQIMEIDKNITALKRQRMTNGISAEDFESKVRTEQEKKMKVQRELMEKLN